MLIHNPDNGAIIRNIWIYDKLYFSDKLQEECKPGDIIEVDNKAGEYLIELLGFLKEVTPLEAQNIIKHRTDEKFICDHEGCGFEAKSKLGLISHKRNHMSSIPGVKVVKPMAEEEEQKEVVDNREKEIESQAKNDGLIGEGLVTERL